MSSDYLETEALIQDFTSGKMHAFNALHQALFGVICTFCYKLTGNRGESEDIAQETFVRLWLKRENLVNLANIRAFLYITSRNLCFDYFRRANSEKKCQGVFKEGMEEDYELQADVLDGLYDGSVRELVKKLPGRQRQVLELLYFDDLSIKEVSAEMEIEVSTVKKLRERGIAVLREIMTIYPSAETVLLLSFVFYKFHL